MPHWSEKNPDAQLAKHLRKKGIRDVRVLLAMAHLDRRLFIPPDGRAHAREDRALPIGLEQTISQPYMVGLMTQELAIDDTTTVLEIGTGSGYQTAILAQLAGQVFTVERLSTLSLRARSLLDGLGLTNVNYRIGDGTLGWPEFAPFDRVLVTAAAPALPEPLFEQLNENGRMVIPIGDDETQQLCRITKRDGEPVITNVLSCRFVKLIGEEGWDEDQP